VHIRKGVCNAVESSGAKSQMESTCVALCVCMCMSKDTRVSEEECYQGWKWGDQVVLCAYKHDFELAILFNVSFFSLSLCLFRCLQLWWLFLTLSYIATKSKEINAILISFFKMINIEKLYEDNLIIDQL